MDNTHNNTHDGYDMNNQLHHHQNPIPQFNQFHQQQQQQQLPPPPQQQLPSQLNYNLLPSHSTTTTGNSTTNFNGNGHTHNINNTSTPPLPILKSSLPDPLLSTSNAQSVSMNRRRSSNTTNSPTNNDFDSKTCQFCHKQFAHKGSLGRHLDFKKGDPWHPIDQVNLIRINASRRRSSDFSFHSIDENSTNNNNNLSSNPQLFL